MPESSVFRLAGWGAFAGVVLMVLFFVALAAAPTSGVSEVLAVVGVGALTPAFYGLYRAHRHESVGWSRLGLVAGVPAAALDIASLLSPGNIGLFALDNLVFAVPFLVFGGLALRSAPMPRALGWVALVTGAAYLLAGVATVAGSQVGGIVKT